MNEEEKLRAMKAMDDAVISAFGFDAPTGIDWGVKPFVCSCGRGRRQACVCGLGADLLSFILSKSELTKRAKKLKYLAKRRVTNTSMKCRKKRRGIFKRCG